MLAQQNKFNYTSLIDHHCCSGKLTGTSIIQFNDLIIYLLHSIHRKPKHLIKKL